MMENNEVKNGVDQATQVQPEDARQETAPTPDQPEAESTDEQKVAEPSIKNTMEDSEPPTVDHIDEKQPESESSVSDDINKVSTVDFEQFPKAKQPPTPHNIDMLLDVTLPISIELGRTNMPIQDILNLGPGSVVELSKLAGEPVDLLVNNKMIARGEVVVVDENFGIRVTSMVSQEDRLKSLG
jgi:flagellar motor switch protein FliN/FliY